MKLTLQTNEDDWRELEFDSENSANIIIEHAGHDIPERVWLDIMRAVGAKVEIIFDEFD